MWIRTTFRLGFVLFLTVGVSTMSSSVLAEEEIFNLSSLQSGPTKEPVTASVRLLYGESHYISWTDLAVDARLPPLLTHMYMDVLGLDYHYQRRCLFYSGWGAIWRLQMNETAATGAPEVMVEDAAGATSVAVDWVRDRVYWVSTADHTVQRVDLEGEGGRPVEVLRNTGNHTQHNNIVLDPFARFLFLAVDGAKFVRSDLDGGFRTDVEVEGYGDKSVVSLAVDVLRRRLYVSARQDYMPRLLSCGYDGSDAREYDLTDEWWDSFVTIGVFKDQLFWAHHGWGQRDTVWKANVTDQGALTWAKEYTAKGTILDPTTRIWVLKVYHSDLQPPGMDEHIVKDRVEVSPKAPPEANNSPPLHSPPGLLLVMIYAMLYTTLNVNQT